MVSEMGYQVGSHVERKSDKSKGQIVSMDVDMIKLEVAESPGLIATVPTLSFLQGHWAKYTPKASPTESLFTLASNTSELKIMAKCAAIFQRMCDLTFTHESSVAGLKFQIKPQKFVEATKKFEKGKLVLVPVCQKVSFKVGDPPPTSSLVVHASGFAGVHFWLVPYGNQYKENTFMAPFYHIGTNHEDFNMEMQWLKVEDFKLPVARNVKVIEEGDRVVLFKEKPPQEPPLVASDSSSLPKTKRKKSN